MKRSLTALEDTSNSLNFIYLTHPQGQGTKTMLSSLFSTGDLVPQDKWNQNNAKNGK